MHSEQPIITTERLKLRPIMAKDINDVYRGLSHPKVISFYGVSFESLAATREQMQWYAQPQQLWWAVMSLDGTQFYGAGGLNDIDLKTGKAEIGFWLLPQHWGYGYMQEVLPLIANHGLNSLGLNRIEGFVDSDNINCKRAMAKLDFTHEKTLLAAEQKAGRSIDVEVYVKTA